LQENIEDEKSKPNSIDKSITFESEKNNNEENSNMSNSNSQQKNASNKFLYNNYNTDEMTEGNYGENLENIIRSDESLLQKSPHFKGEILNNNKFYNYEQKNQQLKNEGNFVDYNIIGNNKIETPEQLVMILKEAIEDTKKQYKLMRKEYIDEVKKKTEAQQLLQKCVEDLKLEISLSIKDIQNHSKFLNIFVKLFIFIFLLEKYNMNKFNFEEILTAKVNNLNNLEHKLKVMTFVYDNGFQNIKNKKNSLLKK